ncbi:MAG: cupin domain-containing protein [Caldilinea sp. CFX5]|nr:cupin domain-containing protein [Caldilinea sp. CFX5]
MSTNLAKPPTTVTLGPNRVTFLLSGAETGGRFSLTEFAAAPPPALAAPIHRHLDADETLYILEGLFQFIVNDQIIPAPVGAHIFIPRRTPHTIENIGTTVGRMLVFLTPPGFEQFWVERAQQFATYGAQVDPALLLALQQKYQMDMGGQVRQFVKA